MRALAILLLLSAAVPALAGDFPADGFVPGWKRSGPVEAYNPSALYNVIDGGAELFLEMGFAELRMQKYAGDGAEIAVEAYRMESPAAALGIYLLKCGRETPLAEIGARNTGDAFQVALVQGDHFFFINNFSGRRELLPVMAELARRLARTVPAAAVSELDVLPPQGMVPGSALLLRGPYSLQAVYTLGEGDVLRLEGKRFAAAAAYREGDGEHTRIVAPYENEERAGQAFASLRRNLDPYLRLLGEGERHVEFQDFQNLFGRAEWRGRQIEIRVRMARRPERAAP